jgi:glucosamine-6-phosphate deaminase
MNIQIMPDKQQMGKSAAAAGAKFIRDALAKRGEANIIVATGASQFKMLAALVAEPDIDWSKVTGFHLDEYVGLPISHPASFRGYLWQRFVSKLPLPLRAFHFLDGEAASAAECQRVGEIIRRHPIDVAFVGIGENGHLAFNDPPADFDTEEPYLVVNLDDACRRQQLGEGWFPTFDDVPKQALSMSVRQIMKSAAIICTVPDTRKAEAVRNSVEGEVSLNVPASILQRHQQCTLFLDKPAAALLANKEA